jgi:hypothetical protein
MATKRRPRRPEKTRKVISDETEMAVILSHAATFGVTAAAREYGLNRRTIQRYQAEVRSGKCPDLARKIAEEKERATQRNRDKMHRALDALLDRVIELAPKADLMQAVTGVEKIGELSSAMVVMGVRKPSVESDGQGKEAPGNAGLGSRLPEADPATATIQ